MIAVVQAQASDYLDLLPRQRRQELLDRENGVGERRGRVENGAVEFEGFDGLFGVVCEAHWEDCPVGVRVRWGY